MTCEAERLRSDYRRRRAEGRCGYPGCKATSGDRCLCATHATMRNHAIAELRRARNAAGRFRYCGEPMANGRYLACFACRMKRTAYAKARKERHAHAR